MNKALTNKLLEREGRTKKRRRGWRLFIVKLVKDEVGLWRVVI